MKYIEIEKISRFVPVTDDWYPNYEGDTVKLILAEYTSWVRISAWGADDFFMINEFEGTQEEVHAQFLRWKEDIYDAIDSPVNQKYFESLGFYTD